MLDLKFNARWFDGVHAKPQDCCIAAALDGALQVTALQSGESVGFAADAWSASEAFAGSPRILTLPTGQIEVDESAQLQAWLNACGKGSSWVERAQISWRKAGAAALVLVLAMAGFYKWGLPLAASVVAAWIPETYVKKLDAESLAQIEKHWAQHSELSMDTQQRVRAKFLALQAPDPNTGAALPTSKLNLQFRRSNFGPNALALPAGTVIVFDELIKLSPSDDAVLGVLAHEWAHVAKRHAMTSLVESTAIGLFLSVYLGDASSVIATVGSGLSFLHYSRKHETESDTFAIATLKANGLGGAGTAELFERMMNWHCHSNGQPSERCAQVAKEAAEKGESIPEFLSSHPATPERIARFRALR